MTGRTLGVGGGLGVGTLCLTSHSPSEAHLPCHICSDEDAVGHRVSWGFHSFGLHTVWMVVWDLGPQRREFHHVFLGSRATVHTGDVLADLGISLGFCAAVFVGSPDASAQPGMKMHQEDWLGPLSQRPCLEACASVRSPRAVSVPISHPHPQQWLHSLAEPGGG